MRLEFATKENMWCVVFVEGGRLTSRVLCCSHNKAVCIQYMEQRGVYNA